MSILKKPTNLEFPKIYPVACHTDNVGPGSTFIAIKGMAFDGVDYIMLAMQKGATKIVVARDVHFQHDDIEVVHVDDTRRALAELSAQAHDYSARKLKLIAITGTKGKTTSTFLLEHILRVAGYKTALLSTVKNSINGVDLPTKLTTQQPDYLHVFFDLCVEQGVEFVVMEVAAQAFSLQRVYGLQFDAAIFTNFSKEHGEFYATMDDYFAAKKQILSYLKEDAPLLLNKDDQRVANLATEYDGSVFFDQQHVYSCSALIGGFNQYNIAGVTECAAKLGLQSEQIQKALDSFVGVPGRLEKYELPNGALGIVDYAHNPSSYEAVLSELRKQTQHLIVVFGCGGDRDASRRPVMGSIASHYADCVVLTSDNPRSEDPATIVRDICAGITEVEQRKIIIELDRERAIQKAYELSRAGSIIALLGKGPDEYQIIKGVTTFFSDKMVLQSL